MTLGKARLDVQHVSKGAHLGCTSCLGRFVCRVKQHRIGTASTVHHDFLKHDSAFVAQLQVGTQLFASFRLTYVVHACMIVELLIVL